MYEYYTTLHRRHRADHSASSSLSGFNFVFIHNLERSRFMHGDACYAVSTIMKVEALHETINWRSFSGSSPLRYKDLRVLNL